MTKRLFTLIVFSAIAFCGYAHKVMPVTKFPSDDKVFYKAEADRMYIVIEKQAHYLLSLVCKYKDDEAFKIITPTQGAGEHTTRPNTCAVATFAFLHRFGDYNPQVVGISRDQLLNDNIIPMVRFLTSLHFTGEMAFEDGSKWGNSWQSALWTHQLGQAVWMVWDQLPADLQQASLRVVSFEANRVAGRKPPFNLLGDSKSEENAWDSMVLSAALLLMPQSPSYKFWEEALQKWQMSSYIAPSDASSEQIVDGRAVKDQYIGANIFNDYTLENHGIAHPDYMTAITMNQKIAMDYVITGRKPLDASLYNTDKIYNQLSFLMLPGCKYVYPSGQDWAIFRAVDYMDLHAKNALFFHNPIAVHWLGECLETAERMQARDHGGAVYAPNENFFASAQAHLGVHLYEAWKALMFADKVESKYHQESGVRVFPDGKFFVRRSPQAMHTVSWGRKIMFQSFRFADDAMIGEDWRNGPGSITVAGSTKPLAVTMSKFAMTEAEGNKPYVFNMTVMHGKAIRADITVTSYANGKMSVSEKLTAVEKVTTSEIATLFIGVLNHPEWVYEKGFRTISCNGEQTTVKSRSGDKVVLKGKSVSVDNSMTVKSKAEFQGSYTGATRWTSSKLMDRLVLNHKTETTEWNAGDVISENALEITYR